MAIKVAGVETDDEVEIVEETDRSAETAASMGTFTSDDNFLELIVLSEAGAKDSTEEDEAVPADGKFFSLRQLFGS